MKKLLVAFLTLSLLLTSGLFAQSAENPDSARITREAQIKEGLQMLGAYVLKYDADSTRNDSLTVATHKTWGDVLNRSLDMFSGAIKEIVETVEKAAPYVMTIMVRQQYAKAVAAIITPLGFLIFVFIYSWYINRKWKPADDEKNSDVFGGTGNVWVTRIAFCRFVPLVAGLFATGFLISGIQESILYGMNPYYYAIRDTLVLLLGSSHGM